LTGLAAVDEELTCSLADIVLGFSVNHFLPNSSSCFLWLSDAALARDVVTRSLHRVPF
jgi:hypothetical protein